MYGTFFIKILKTVTNIPFLEIESIPKLIKDFLNAEIPGFEEQIFSVENFGKQIEAKQKEYSTEKRIVLADALTKQMSALELSEKQKSNLELLQNENTFTVVTGHQLNLFTGPSFFIYKILQTIKTAEFIAEKFKDINVVPVFWMATEDHDFDEINHFKTENNFYEIKGDSGGAVGRIKVEDQYFISEFESEFKDSVYGTELIRWMKEAYSKGNTLAEATRILVNRIFSDYGILIVDGDDVALKTLMKDIFREELLLNQLFESSKEKVEMLSNQYGKVQVNPREINLFYLSETRDRIEFSNNQFQIVDKNISFTKEQILTELEKHPEKFSPNALMRPVYQENILPNLAYIGGNAEIMYWLELQDYFKHLNLKFPVLIPRNSMLFLKEKTLQKAEKLDLKISDFFENFAQLIRSKLTDNHEISALINSKEAELKASFELMKSKAEITDQSFRNLIEAEETRQLKSFDRMRKRLLRAEKIKQQEKLQRIEDLFLDFHPGKNWQERVLNFSVFYADFGRDWLQTCYDKMEVRNSELIIMQI